MQKDDVISRRAAIDALICKMRPHNNGDGTMTICVMSEGLVKETLNDLPPAQPERKNGKWVKENRGGVEYTAGCSECGYGTYWSDTQFYNYCPYCGSFNKEI